MEHQGLSSTSAVSAYLSSTALAGSSSTTTSSSSSSSSSNDLSEPMLVIPETPPRPRGVKRKLSQDTGTCEIIKESPEKPEKTRSKILVQEPKNKSSRNFCFINSEKTTIFAQDEGEGEGEEEGVDYIASSPVPAASENAPSPINPLTTTGESIPVVKTSHPSPASVPVSPPLKIGFSRASGKALTTPTQAQVAAAKRMLEERSSSLSSSKKTTIGIETNLVGEKRIVSGFTTGNGKKVFLPPGTKSKTNNNNSEPLGTSASTITNLNSPSSPSSSSSSLHPPISTKTITSTPVATTCSTNPPSTPVTTAKQPRSLVSGFTTGTGKKVMLPPTPANATSGPITPSTNRKPITPLSSSFKKANSLTPKTPKPSSSSSSSSALATPARAVPSSSSKLVTPLKKETPTRTPARVPVSGLRRPRPGTVPRGTGAPPPFKPPKKKGHAGRTPATVPRTSKAAKTRPKVPLEAIPRKQVPPRHVAVGLNPPQVTALDAALSSDVSPMVSLVTCDTAARFSFPMPPAPAPLPSPWDSVLAGSTRPHNLGVKEFAQALRVDPTVDPDAVTEKWVLNHYRWIVWKRAALARAYLEPTVLTPEAVLKELKSRFEREYHLAGRSVLRKLFEGDSSAVTPMVLVVAATNATLASNPNEVLLTDGWYSMQAKLDDGLKKQVRAGKIVAGTKLWILGANLIAPQLCGPLEAPAQGTRLELSFNSVKRARFDARLGAHRIVPPPMSFASIGVLGGPVPLAEAAVERVFPPRYLATFPGPVGWLGEPIRIVRRSAEELSDLVPVLGVPEKGLATCLHLVLRDRAGCVRQLKWWGVDETCLAEIRHGAVLRLWGAVPAGPHGLAVVRKKTKVQVVRPSSPTFSAIDVLPMTVTPIEHCFALANDGPSGIPVTVDIVGVVVGMGCVKEGERGGTQHIFLVDESQCVIVITVFHDPHPVPKILPRALMGDAPVVAVLGLTLEKPNEGLGWARGRAERDTVWSLSPGREPFKSGVAAVSQWKQTSIGSGCVRSLRERIQQWQ